MGVSAYQFRGGAACYPKYTKSFGDARSAFAFPSPVPHRSALACHPLRFPPFLTSWIMLDKLTIQSNTKGYTAPMPPSRRLKDQFKRIMEIDDRTSERGSFHLRTEMPEDIRKNLENKKHLVDRQFIPISFGELHDFYR